MLANTELPAPGDKDSAGSFAAKMACAAVGYVMADVAADGLLVQHAKEEPTETRGSLQSTVYLVRTCGSIAAIFVGLCMNGKNTTLVFFFFVFFAGLRRCRRTFNDYGTCDWIYIEECNCTAGR